MILRIGKSILLKLTNSDMIIVKNKFNIGDIVYAAGISDEDNSRYEIARIHSIVNEDTNVVVTYDLKELDGHFNSYLCSRYFLESELFWTYEECINRMDSGIIKRTINHFEGILLRVFYLIVLFFSAIPFFAIQFIHWLFTGRKESRTYFLMSKLTNKL